MCKIMEDLRSEIMERVILQNIRNLKAYSHQQSLLTAVLKKGGVSDWMESGDDMDQQRLVMFKAASRATKAVVLEDMLSDEKCNEIIDNNFCRIIKHGDYYTLKAAKRIIDARSQSCTSSKIRSVFSRTIV